MSRRNEMEELLGSVPVPGEDPRFSDGEGVWISDNDASQQIEDFDAFDPVNVNKTPWMPQVVDDDGGPGNRLFAEANESFEQAEGLEAHDEVEESPDDEVVGDEFHARLASRAASSFDSSGRPLSDLAMLTRVANAEQESTEALAKHVRISPPSAYTALMGGNAKITSGERSIEVGRWEGASDVEAQPVTVAFSRVAPDPDTIDGPSAGMVRPFRPFGIVQWGTRNAAISVIVDIGPGTQFTIAATSVNIQVGMDDDETLVGLTPPGSLDLAGQLAFWTVMRTVPVTRTLYFDVPAAGVATSETFIVPQFAKRLWLYRTDDTQLYSVAFQDSQGNTVYTLNLAAGAFQTNPVLLSGDVYFIQVTTGPARLEDFRLVFELSL